MKITVLDEKQHNGYIVRKELHEDVYFNAAVIHDPNPDGEMEKLVEDIENLPTTVEMDVCYTLDGAYIGNEKIAKLLIEKRGIVPELRPGAKVCSIGFCEKEQKWYGWSHRAIYGFGIGHVVEEGNCEATPGVTDEYLLEHPEADISMPAGFRVTTLEEAKQVAIAFAESVG